MTLFGKISQRFARARWGQLALFAVAVALVQALYWLAVYPALFSRPDPAMLDRLIVENVRVAELASPTPQAAAAAVHRPARFMVTDCCDRSYLSLMADIELDAVPAEGLGIIHVQQVDNFIFLVNGTILSAEGAMQFGERTFHGQLASLARIPAGVLRPGTNTITYITVRDGFPYTDLLEPMIGQYREVQRWAASRMWLRNVFPLVTGGITAVLALIAALMVFRSQDRRFAFWLFGLSAAWTSFCAYVIVPELPFGGTGRMIWFFTFNSFIPVALLCFIDAWSRRPVPFLQPVSVAIWLAYVGWMAWSLVTVPMPAGFDGPGYGWSYMLSGFAVATLARLLWHFATEPDERLVEAAAVSVVVVAGFFNGIGEHVGLPQASHLLMDTMPLFLVAITAAFVQRNFALFQSAESLNERLATDLAAREVDLRGALAREAGFIRAEAHNEERRRIMRDMHDGLGSQLMGMLLAARRGKVEAGRVAEGLQSVIDEIRLMIDSMDSVGESLGSAFATFRSRVEPRVTGAGFGFEWRQDPALAFPDYPPRATLQVFRILQEAVTNALKHAGGGAVNIRVLAGQQPGEAMQVVVSDDGPGIPDTAPAGHGLTNMRRRAAQIGARLETGSRPDGSGGQLVLGLPAEAAAL